MSHCVHHVPGRLRVKVPGMKRNPRIADAVQDLLAHVDGVRTSEVNLAVGCVRIRYDMAATDADSVLTAMDQAGFLCHDPSFLERRPQTATRAGQMLGRALFGVFVDQTLQRSLNTLVGVLK
jgi:cation transport ATPase